MLIKVWDWLTSKVLKHNPATAIAVVFSGILTVVGCQPTTQISPISGETVTQDEFVSEYNKSLIDLETEWKSIDRRQKEILEEMDRIEAVGDSTMESFKQAYENRKAQWGSLIETVKLVPGAEPALPFLPYISTIITGGLFVDNRIKDRKIKNDSPPAPLS